MVAVVLLNGSRAASKIPCKEILGTFAGTHAARWISAGTWRYLLEGHLGEGVSVAGLVLAGISQ